MQYYECWTDEGKGKKYGYIYDFTVYPSKKGSCTLCGRGFHKFFYDINADISVSLSNSHFPDIINDNFLYISEKAHNLLIENNYDYLEFIPTKILTRDELTKEQIKSMYEGGINHNKIPTVVPQYYRVKLPDGGKVHKDVLSKYNYCKECGYSLDFTKTFPIPDNIIDLNSIKGFDLFEISGWGSLVFCTQNFVDLYKANGLTGCNFKSIECKF